MIRKEMIMWQSWINLAIGLWLILCGFVPALQTPDSMIIPGILALIFGFWSTTRVSSWEGVINGIAGIWLFLSGLWFQFYLPWNFLVIGGIITVLSLWNLAEHPDPSHIPYTVK